MDRNASVKMTIAWRILQAIADRPITSAQIAEVCGLTRKQASSNIYSLRQRGRIVKHVIHSDNGSKAVAYRLAQEAPECRQQSLPAVGEEMPSPTAPLSPFALRAFRRGVIDARAFQTVNPLIGTPYAQLWWMGQAAVRRASDQP